MRALKLLAGLVLLLAGVFVIGGLFLPDKTHVERSIDIARPPQQVFDFLNGFARFQEWSPWGPDFDPSQVTTLSGPPSGVGAQLSWTGHKAGSGSQTILASDPPRQIDIALDFGPQGKAIAHYTLSAAEVGTRLVWSFDVDAEGRFADRWMGLLFERLIGADYEKGLARLKQVIEADPPPPAPVAAQAAETLPAAAEEIAGAGESEPDAAPAEPPAD